MECLHSFASAITYYGCGFSCCDRIITRQILNDWTLRFPRLHVKTISPVESHGQTNYEYFLKDAYIILGMYIQWIYIITWSKKKNPLKDVTFKIDKFRVIVLCYLKKQKCAYLLQTYLIFNFQKKCTEFLFIQFIFIKKKMKLCQNM